MGEAAPGAVLVLGGALQVRDPRDPKLPRPPIRASAAEPAKINAAARAIIARLRREVFVIIIGVLFPLVVRSSSGYGNARSAEQKMVAAA